MADFVVGMAKSVVDGVLTKTQAAIDEEAKLRQIAHRDLVYITGEFQMMQSFLNVADKDRCKNQVIRTLVRQIRDLAYDVEDCIEFVVHLDKKNRWWLRLLNPARCIIRCLPEIPLDVAVADIEQLKAMVEDVSRRNQCYSHGLITDAGSDSSPPEPASRTVGATEFNRLIEAAENLKGAQGDLTQLLTKEDGGLQVISIWGTGGGYPGMASIIWSAYADKDTCNTFTCRAWVKLRHPFNQREFVRSVMAQFHASKPQEDKEGNAIPVDVLKMMKCKQGVLLAEFVTYVNEKKYLLVLEGLSTMEEWNAIRTFFPNRKNGSCIILSTQQFEVASLSVGHPFQVLDLNQLSAEHSVFAFSQRGSERDGVQGAQTIDDGLSSGMNAIISKKNSAEMWMKSYPLVGRESLMNDLRKDTTDALFESNHVMSVWGIAGVGKSSLVRILFCERILMKRSIHQMYGWVDVSHPFNLMDLSRCLLLSLHSESVQAMETSYYGNIGSENPIVQCQKMLKQNRCLVVIDGLQCTKEWDLIKAGLGSGYHDRTLFIIITNDEKVARHCCGDKGEFVFNVTGLDPDAAFHLFGQISSKNLSSLLESELSELRELTSKCGGLPKVIVEVASSLASKTVGWMDHARSVKKKFIQAMETNPELNKFEGLHDWMNAYFRNCPDVLKPCVYYLSIFPQDHKIRRRRLVRRWIAEGYSSNTNDKSAEENGEKYFSDLLDRSIIQQPSEIGFGNMRAVLCQVNGFFREYISSQWMEENLVFELDCSCVLPTQRSGRHLVISETWKRHRTVFESIDFSRLRSLTLFGTWESFLISENMKVLRVLDLEDASGVNNEDLKNIVKRLGRLKFLSLRGCQDISDLPSELGHLRQLQTLDVRGTSIRTLPKNITKLQKLQYIRGGKTNQAEGPFLGVKVPPGIGKLTVLHTLGVVNISVSGTEVLEQLRKLTLLHKLGVSGINKSNSNKFFSAISDLALMESLSMRLAKNSQGCLDFKDLTLGLERLRSLKLYGLGNMLPEWTKKLSRLAKLDLEMEALMKKDIEFIGKLQELCILRLRAKRLQDGELRFCVIKNGVEDDSYQKVRILDIGCSLSAHVTFGLRTMKKLDLLKVDSSSTSPLQFLGLEKLPELKEVVLLKGYNDESLKTHLNALLAQHPRKPVVTCEL
ncbi:unnamed protein product [Urochloa humidicola]